MNSMKILLINPYFGALPFWMDAFLLSCEKNPGVEWLVPTDCQFPDSYPKNVRFIKTSLSDLCDRASEVTGVKIQFERPYKVCDIRPAFGLIYSEYVKDYDFWGHCDFDVIWGQISSYINDDVLRQYDIISSRKEMMSGHFSLYRNNGYINNLFRYHPIWERAMTEQISYYFDEVGMTEVVKMLNLKVYWEKYLFNSTTSNRPGNIPLRLNYWVWNDGKVYNVYKNEEVMYVNFMNWKDWLIDSDICFSDSPGRFYLSFSHFSLKKALYPLLSVKHFKPLIKLLLFKVVGPRKT